MSGPLDLGIHQLFEDAPCGFVAHAPSGSIVLVNRTLATWLGRSKDELLALTFADLLTLAGRLFYENQYAPLLRLQGSVKDAAFELVRSEGPALPVLITSTEQREPDGSVQLVVSTVFDATDRRRYERELLNARRRAEELAAVVTASGDAILLIGPNGVVRTWNAGASRLFARDAAEMIGRAVGEILPALHPGAAWTRVIEELGAGRPHQFDTVGRAADGAAVDVSVALAPHLGPLNELDAISLIVRDVSARREIERLQQEFLAMAGHELRSPITAIRGHAQLLIRRGAYSESSISTIVRQTVQLDRLVEDLLLASQIEAQRLELRIGSIDLIAEVHAAVDLMRSEERSITLAAPAAAIPVQADRQRLGQVFANLLTNAVKYSAAGTPIEVRVTDDGATARVAITDHGSGIPADALPLLFDRFYRVRETAAKARGLGLGLYITRRLVEAHHGTVEVESEVGRGSSFVVTLPVAG